MALSGVVEERLGTRAIPSQALENVRAFIGEASDSKIFSDAALRQYTKSGRERQKPEPAASLSSLYAVLPKGQRYAFVPRGEWAFC